MDKYEIIEFSTSQDTYKVWEAACAIINQGQDREKIVPLIEDLPQIKAKTVGLNMEGKKHFLDFAIKTIEFHALNQRCPCALYVEKYQLMGDNLARMVQYERFNPNKEFEKGYIKILETRFLENSFVDLYIVTCSRCSTEYEVEEREYHFQWWHWKRVIKNAQPIKCNAIL
jgi:hypothetical protein